ncbi:hypothetical protein JNUCC0626_24615 [Lentzea sp. JNUCC 0626]|uniref:hypothetical protein n=1 Tax=Lentzea sp. JNUCC 0626 TaxID=3367513 RepID=UPI00374A4BFF
MTAHGEGRPAGDGAASKNPNEQGNSTASRPLTGLMSKILRTGTKGKYPRPEAAVLAVMTSALNKGWTWAKFHTEWSQPECGMRLKLVSDGAELLKLWEKASAFVADSPPVISASEARQELGLIRAELSSTVLEGRNRVRDREVLKFILKKATRQGRLVLPLALRTIAEGTGQSVETSRRALESLVSRGWLTVHTPSHRALATTYRVHTPSRRSSTGNATSAPSISSLQTQCTDETPLRRRDLGEDCVSSVHSMASTDVFRSLGRSAAVLYDHLSVTSPMKATELVDSTELARRTVFKWLGRLKEEGLAAQVEGGAWVRVEVDLEALAEVMGVSGKAEAQKAQHAREREAWALRVAKPPKVASEQSRASEETRTAEVVIPMRRSNGVRRAGRKNRKRTRLPVPASAGVAA